MYGPRHWLGRHEVVRGTTWYRIGHGAGMHLLFSPYFASEVPYQCGARPSLYMTPSSREVMYSICEVVVKCETCETRPCNIFSLYTPRQIITTANH